MQLEELEKLKKENPKVAILLSQLGEYFIGLLNKDPKADIVPILVAKRLSINESLALALLMLFDKKNLIEPSYQVYCEQDNNYIKSYDSLKSIPQKVYCPFHDTEHNENDYYVELVFHFTPRFLSRYEIALVGA